MSTPFFKFLKSFFSSTFPGDPGGKWTGSAAFPLGFPQLHCELLKNTPHSDLQPAEQILEFSAPAALGVSRLSVLDRLHACSFCNERLLPVSKRCFHKYKKRQSFDCLYVGVTYLPGPSPDKYFRQK